MGYKAWKHLPIKLASKVQLIQFDEDQGSILQRSLLDSEYKHMRKAVNKAERTRQQYGRLSRITHDVGLKIQGKENLDSRGRKRTNEWEKPWVRRTAMAGIVGATALAHHKLRGSIRKSMQEEARTGKVPSNLLDELTPSNLMGIVKHQGNKHFPKAMDSVRSVRDTVKEGAKKYRTLINKGGSLSVKHGKKALIAGGGALAISAGGLEYKHERGKKK